MNKYDNSTSINQVKHFISLVSADQIQLQCVTFNSWSPDYILAHTNDSYTPINEFLASPGNEMQHWYSLYTT